jgi:hypothetical protein
MLERRREQRLMCSDLIHIRLHGVRGPGALKNAILEDISSAGACVQIEEQVPVGARVDLLIEEHVLRGTVRYCLHREPIGYFAGMEFDAGVRWSRELVLPGHLTDPRTIGRKQSG